MPAPTAKQQNVPQKRLSTTMWKRMLIIGAGVLVLAGCAWWLQSGGLSVLQNIVSRTSPTPVVQPTPTPPKDNSKFAGYKEVLTVLPLNAYEVEGEAKIDVAITFNDNSVVTLINVPTTSAVFSFEAGSAPSIIEIAYSTADFFEREPMYFNYSAVSQILFFGSISNEMEWRMYFEVDKTEGDVMYLSDKKSALVEL